MYRVFRSEHYENKLSKIDASELQRVLKFEQALKQEPYAGKPLGYKFFREKKFNGKRLLFLVYDEHQCIFLVTLTDKKAQQHEIDFIKAHLDAYREELREKMNGL
jgi:mRNA-degrading endonuclease RelE of RelBE toxin-antitoxin system